MGEFVSGESVWRRTRRVQPVAQPAAGADWSVTVPAGVLWELLAVRGLFTASAAVANRVPVLGFGSEGVTAAQVPVAANITAGQAITVTWAQVGAALAFGLFQIVPLPRVILEPGDTIGTATGAIDVGDQWSAVRLWLVETTVKHGPLSADSVPDLRVEVIAAPSG